MKIMKSLMAVVFVAAFAGSAGAATIYVDASNGCPGTGTVGDPYCDFAGATTVAGAGDTILAASGTYAETLTPPVVANLTIIGNAGSRPQITGGAQLDPPVSGPGGDALTLQNLHFSGYPSGEGFILALAVPSANLTIDNCVFDGNNVLGKHGVGSGLITESLTVRNSEFKDVMNWALFESRSGSGGDGSPMTDVLFENNYIHDVNGTVALRGAAANYTDSVIVRNNTWDNVGGANGVVLTSPPGAHWAAIEVNRADDVQIYNNSVNDVISGNYGEGQCFQVWNIPQLEIYDNCCTNTDEGIWLAIVNNAVDGGVTSGGSIHDNTFINQTDWALQVSVGAPTAAEFDVNDNYWGAADGPSGTGFGGSGGVIIDTPVSGGKAEADATTFLTSDVACATAGVPASSTIGLILTSAFILTVLSLIAVVLRRRSSGLTSV